MAAQENASCPSVNHPVVAADEEIVKHKSDGVVELEAQVAQLMKEDDSLKTQMSPAKLGKKSKNVQKSKGQKKEKKAPKAEAATKKRTKTKTDDKAAAEEEEAKVEEVKEEDLGVWKNVFDEGSIPIFTESCFATDEPEQIGEVNEGDLVYPLERRTSDVSGQKMELFRISRDSKIGWVPAVLLGPYPPDHPYSESQPVLFTKMSPAKLKEALEQIKAEEERARQEEQERARQQEQAVEALKQAMVTNTVDALRGAIDETKKIKGFNPPELKKAEEALIQSARTRAKAGEWTHCCACGHKHCGNRCDPEYNNYSKCGGQNGYKACCKCKNSRNKDGKVPPEISDSDCDY